MIAQMIHLNSRAAEAFNAVHAAGLRVPEDYSIVSYDNSSADTLFEPTLSAVDQDVVALAEHAVTIGQLSAQVTAGVGGNPARVRASRVRGARVSMAGTVGAARDAGR